MLGASGAFKSKSPLLKSNPSAVISFVAAFVQRLDAGASVSDLQRSLKHKLKIKIIQFAAHPSLLSSLGAGELPLRIPASSMRPTPHYFVIAHFKRAKQPSVVPAAIPFRLWRSLPS